MPRQPAGPISSPTVPTPGPAFRPLLTDALAAQDAGEFEDEDGALRWLAARTAVELV